MKIKNNKEVLISVIVILCFIIVLSFINASNENKKIYREVYKKLDKDNKISVIVKLNSEKKFRILNKRNLINSIGKEKIKHDFGNSFSAEITKEELKYLKNSNIREVRVSRPIKAFLQDSAGLVNATDSWNINLSSQNITGIHETICVVDSGINFSHPDLAGKNMTPCLIDCITDNCIENCSVYDDETDGHGTHVAGIAAASGTLNGIAKGANLIGVKVLDNNGDGIEPDLIAGINWCVNNREAYNISVISLSLGTDCDLNPEYCYDHYCDAEENLLAEPINNATFYNISVITSTGNDGNTVNISSPACLSNSSAVGWSDKNDNINSNSNRNNITDFLAPGSDINSTKSTGGYKVLSGSSMSCPHVSGAFALLRHYFRLQNNRIPEPSEIKDALNDTGIMINDSGTGLNFPRIDILSAIISIDNTGPDVKLISPGDNTPQENNVIFNCSANDAWLSNLTLYVWNPNNVYSTASENVSGVNSEANFTLSEVPAGNYKWNCLGVDSRGNQKFAVSNNSFYINNVSVSLISPADNSYVNNNQSYNCSAESVYSSLENITFYIWRSGSLVYNETKALSGTADSEVFNYSFQEQGSYEWNCRAFDNSSKNSSALNNYTINYDSVKPVVTLIDPTSGTSYTSDSKQVSFSYNVTDSNDISNCSLIINSAVSSTDVSISKLIDQSFIKTLSPGDYTWSINCTDLANNKNNSIQRNLTINSEDDDDGGGSSGGGSSAPTYMTYIPNLDATEKGYNKNLRKNDRIKFISKKTTLEHLLKMNDIGNSSVNLTVESDVFNVTLEIGEEKKLNLSSAEYYEILIRLNSISDNKGNITIKTIDEEIPLQKEKDKKITAFNETERDIDNETKIYEDIQGPDNKISRIIFALIIIFIIITIIILVVYY
ncbi:S8 family serine peptidase, partial [Candidatus Pacearchaeota archaeon]|nr:S8 family serine peptidase [Candidatus Pacearchaeota archaeon]